MLKLLSCVLALGLFIAPAAAQQKIHKKAKGQGLTAALDRHTSEETSILGTTTWTPIAGTDATFTVDHQATIIVHGLVDVRAGQFEHGLGFISVSIDGQADTAVPRLGLASSGLGPYRTTVPLLYMTTLAPGTHTVRLEWRISEDAGGDQTYGFTAENRRMYALIY